jgi:transposase
LTYPLPTDLDELAVERLLFPPSEPSAVQRPEPDWAQMHAGLRRKGVTLDLLWQEYKSEQADGYQYSAFCEHYRRWRQRLSLSMRQTHTPGEKLCIDYAGQTVSVTDQHTGEIREALRRRARGVQLYLPRGDLVAAAAGLDRQPCARHELPRRHDGVIASWRLLR